MSDNDMIGGYYEDSSSAEDSGSSDSDDDRGDTSLVQRLVREELESIKLDTGARAFDKHDFRRAPDEEIEKKPKKKRRCMPRRDYWQSPWGLMLKDRVRLRDPSTNVAKSFRRRFRIPFPVFEAIVAACKAGDWFPLGSVDACKRPAAPIDLKILGVHRYMGRGMVLDDIEELAFISPPHYGGLALSI